MKKPWLAFLLNFLLAGAGLAYLGMWGWAVLNLFVVLALGFVLAATAPDSIGPISAGLGAASGALAMALAQSRNAKINTQSAGLPGNSNAPNFLPPFPPVSPAPGQRLAPVGRARFCGDCGAEVGASKFCPQCGGPVIAAMPTAPLAAPIAEPPAPPAVPAPAIPTGARARFCGDCGADVGASKFCPECGVPVMSVPAVNPAPEPPPVAEPPAQPAASAPVIAIATHSKFCGDCGAEVGKAKFCPECGSKVHSVNRCPSCGAVHSATKFCPECGQKAS